jgi:Flp pilus assembly protein TadD
MHSKLVFSALVVAALFGTPAIASAQTQPMAGASAESNASNAKSNAMASMRYHRHHHHMGYSRARMDRSRPGGRPISRKPPS